MTETIKVIDTYRTRFFYWFVCGMIILGLIIAILTESSDEHRSTSILILTLFTPWVLLMGLFKTLMVTNVGFRSRQFPFPTLKMNWKDITRVELFTIWLLYRPMKVLMISSKDSRTRKYIIISYWAFCKSDLRKFLAVLRHFAPQASINEKVLAYIN